MWWRTAWWSRRSEPRRARPASRSSRRRRWSISLPARHGDRRDAEIAAAASRRGCWSPPTARARGCVRSPASARSGGPTASRASWRRSRTSARTTAGRRSTSCRAGRSRRCRSPAATARRWCGRSRREVAERLVGGDRLLFQVELERRFGHHLGALTVEGSPRAFPLALQLARSFVAPRFALVGDARTRSIRSRGRG